MKEKLAAVFDLLTSAITVAIKNRDAWLDANIDEFARFKVGDNLFYSDGYHYGRVTERTMVVSFGEMDVMYRFHEGRSLMQSWCVNLYTVAEVDAQMAKRERRKAASARINERSGVTS